jgi:hypothetical protein
VDRAIRGALRLACIDTLRLALSILNSEDVWIQHAYARNQWGLTVRVEDSTAKKFDLTGALMRARDRLKSYDVMPDWAKDYGWTQGTFNDAVLYNDAFVAIGDYLAGVTGSVAMSSWNDHPHRTWDEVLDLLDAALGDFVMNETVVVRDDGTASDFHTRPAQDVNWYDAGNSTETRT